MACLMASIVPYLSIVSIFRKKERTIIINKIFTCITTTWKSTLRITFSSCVSIPVCFADETDAAIDESVTFPSPAFADILSRRSASARSFALSRATSRLSTTSNSSPARGTLLRPITYQEFLIKNQDAYITAVPWAFNHWLKQKESSFEGIMQAWNT